MSLTSRRQFVLKILAGTLALPWLPAFAAKKKKAPPPPVCRLTAEQEEGPFYIKGEPLRSNVFSHALKSTTYARKSKEIKRLSYRTQY